MAIFVILFFIANMVLWALNSYNKLTPEEKKAQDKSQSLFGGE